MLSWSTILTYLEMGLGGFAVGWVNDSYTQPFLEGALPMLQTDHTSAKVVDAVSLGVTTYVASEILDGVGLGRVAVPIRGGGYIYTAFKALTVAIPGAEAKLTTPSPLSLFRASLAMNGDQGKVLDASGRQVQGPPSGALLANPSASSVQASGYGLNPAGQFANVPKPASLYLDAGA